MLFVHIMKTKTDKFNQFIKNHVRIDIFLWRKFAIARQVRKIKISNLDHDPMEVFR